MLTGCKIDSRFLDKWERDVSSGLERGTERPFALVHGDQVQWHLGLLWPAHVDSSALPC
jgi:hypothetical protein